MHKYLLLLFLLVPVVALAQEPNRAAVVVAFDDGTAVSQCVTFDEPSISGYDLLQRTGLDLVVSTGGLGTAVCRIADSGCPANDCFCQCKGADCEYWSYWHWQDGDWQYARIGSHAYQVEDGAIEGWTWGPGSVTEAARPPQVDFAEVCSEANGAGMDTAVSTPTNLLPYAAFGIILLLLGGLALRKRGSEIGD